MAAKVKTDSKARLDPKWNPFGPDGRLTYPSIDCVKSHAEDMKIRLEKRAKKLDDFSENIITLKELKQGSKYGTEKSRLPTKRRRKLQQDSLPGRDETVYQDQVSCCIYILCLEMISRYIVILVYELF